MMHGVIFFQISFWIFVFDFIRIQNVNGASFYNKKFNISRHGRQTETTACPITQFKCDSGECIEDSELCDGKGNCVDNSDENINVCNIEKCPNIAFTCNYGACIHINGRCNGLRDCFDGSDEEYCTYSVTNATSPITEGCPFPNNPLHGKYALINHLSDEYNPGDIVPVFSKLYLNCNKGYAGNPPEDDSPSYCLPTKQWNPAPKVCARISLFSTGCRFPNNPSHGKFIVINHLSVGYKPGDIVPVYSLLSVNCNSGYVINPSEDYKPSYCLPTEEWSPAPKNCALMQFNKGCRLPKNPPHGKYVVINHLSSGYNSGDIAPVHSLLSLTCNKGYEVNSNAGVAVSNLSNCLPTGEWTRAPKNCKIMSLHNEGCIFPTNPSDGKYVVVNQSSEYNPGDIVPVHGLLFVNCSRENKVNLTTNENPSRCLPSGEWNPAPGKCPSLRFYKDGCRFPNNILYGKYTVINQSSLTYNPGDLVPVHSSLSVRCNKGYEVNYETDYKPTNCLPNGEWTSPPKICIPLSVIIKECQIPNDPLHGKYVVINNISSKYIPGDVVPFESVLSVNCAMGFAVSPPENNNSAYCLSTGQWFPPPKTCARACPTLVSTETTNVLCEFNGIPLNTCLNAVENTLARLSCADFYEEVNMQLSPTRLCQDGSWGYSIPQCYPICGKKRPSRILDMVNGSTLTPENYPWQIGVYDSQRMYVCGGSLINQRIVLSAGKYYYSKYDDKRDINAQYSDVNEIHIPENFQGEITSYEADIAIIILSTPFQLSVNLQPVCINLEDEYNNKFNGYGTVIGWSTVYENNEDTDDTEPSEVLHEEPVLFVDYNKCFKQLFRRYKKYLTPDKICGEYSEDVKSITQLRRRELGVGDGLVYSKESTDRYFVKGIRTTHVLSTDKAYASNYYGIYTSVTAHIHFMRELVTSNAMQNLYKKHVLTE